jgi:hypothetical protein
LARLPRTLLTKCTLKTYAETDGSITLSLNEIDLAENDKTESDARLVLGKSILGYAEEYFNDFIFWNSAPNRKNHLPYVLKALTISNAKVMGDSILCQAGNN